MLHYDEYGRPGSPALLLLHGAAALDTFSQQYDLTEKYHLIVPHLPGAGDNAGLVYRPEEAVQALLELISSLRNISQRLGESPEKNGGSLQPAGYSVQRGAEMGLAGAVSGAVLAFYPGSGPAHGGVFPKYHPGGLPFFFHQHPGFGPTPGISGGVRPHAGNLRQPGSQGYARLSDAAGRKSPLRDGSAARLRP